MTGLTVATLLLHLLAGCVAARPVGSATWLTPSIAPDAAYPLWAMPAVLLYAVSGVALALVVPALPWVWRLGRGRLRPGVLFSRAFVLNLVQATLMVSAWKFFAGEAPPRTAFVLWQAGVAAAGVFACSRTPVLRRRPGHAEARAVLVGALVLLVLLPALLWGKVFIEDASGDGTEAFEFSRSLSTHQLPHWDLENGYYGFYPAFMLFAYPTQLSFITLGETEGAQRLPVFLYAFGIFLVVGDLVARRRAIPGPALALLAGSSVYFLLYHVHHSTYEVVSDIAEPTGVDVFFTFLATSALYALITRHRLLWALLAVFGSMALAAGLPFAVLFLAGHALARRAYRRWALLRSHAADAAAFGAAWIAYQLFVLVYTRFHPVGVTKWSAGDLFQRYTAGFDVTAWLIVVATWALAVAFVPLAGLAFMAGRDRLQRSLGLPVLGYLGLLLVFGRVHPHYVIPLSLFPVAMFLRGLAAAGPLRPVGYVSHGLVLVWLIAAVVPADRSPHVVYRDFGSRTLMLFDSYPDAVRAASAAMIRRPELSVHLRYGWPVFGWEPFQASGGRPLPNPGDRELQQRLSTDQERGVPVPWGVSHHTWVRYADREPRPGRTYDQMLVAPHRVPEHADRFERDDLPDGSVLLYRRDRSIFAGRSPVLAGPDRPASPERPGPNAAQTEPDSPQD